MRKDRDLEKLDLFELKALQEKTTAEILKRELGINGYEREKFEDLHGSQGHHITYVSFGTRRSGFVNVGFSPNDDYELYLNVYKAQCSQCGTSSAKFDSLIKLG